MSSIMQHERCFERRAGEIVIPKSKFSPMSVLEALEEAAQMKDVLLNDFTKLFGKENWRIGKDRVLDDLLFDPSNQHLDVLFDPNVLRGLFYSANVIDAAVAMLEPLLKVAKDIQDGYRRFLGPIIPKLSVGILSLPDELLQLVFSFAVHSEGRHGTKQALSLSHINRRLRNICLAERRLWTTLSTDMSNDLLRTVISRSGSETRFRSFIHIGRYWSKLTLDNFIRTCSDTLSRWKCLSLSEEDWDWEDDSGDKSFERRYRLDGRPNWCNVKGVSARLQEILVGETKFNSLEEVNLVHYGKPEPLAQSSTKPWLIHVPRLLSLSLGGALPFQYPSMTSLTDFVVTWNEFRDNFHEFKALFKFLSSSPHLAHLKLAIKWGKSHSTSMMEGLFPYATCSSLTSLGLDIVAGDGNAHDPGFLSVRGLVCGLDMPRLEALSISLDVGDLNGEILDILLPETLANSSKLTSFELSVISRYPALSTRSLDFIVPLHRIPFVSSIMISSNVRPVTNFTWDEKAALSAHAAGGEMKSGKSFRLREVAFLGWKRLYVDDLRLTMQSLQNIGCWNSLQRLAVEYSKPLTHTEAHEAVGERKLRYLA